MRRPRRAAKHPISSPLLGTEETAEFTPSQVAMEEKNFKCPMFKINGTLEISQWLRFFDKKCSENRITEEGKCNLVSEFLDDEALDFYISHCMDLEDWNQIKQKFIDHFTSGKNCTFEDLVNTKFATCDNIMAYFNKKYEVGKKLGLDDNLIIESLNHGLPTTYRNIMNSHDFLTTSDWIRVARRILSNSQPEPSTQENQRTRSHNQDDRRPRYEPREPRSNQHPRPPHSQHQHRRQPLLPHPHRTYHNTNWNRFSTRPAQNYR